MKPGIAGFTSLVRILNGRTLNRERLQQASRREMMSRAFVKEDGGGVQPGRFGLPPRESPEYDAAAARALLEAASDANTESAEAATGYRWREPRLERHVRRLLEDAQALPEAEQNPRFIRVARRFLGE